MSDFILQAINLRKQYNINQGHILAIENISIAVEQGEFLSIVGPSGCGKSTLLRILAGLLEPDRGDVCLQGQPLKKPSHKIGLVFQKINLMPWRTTLDNVMLPLQIQNVPPDEAKQRAVKALKLVDLAEFANNYPHELSGGMAQRAAIARALTFNPEILLMDEPFGALDALTRERLNYEIMRIWEQSDETVIMVTHDVREAVFMSDRVLVLSHRPGRVTATIPVTLPRPRSASLFYNDDFNTLAYTVRQAIH